MEKLKRIEIQAKFFQPKFIIPFASFVRFCHKDNYYMNDQMNKIEDVENVIKLIYESLLKIEDGETFSYFK